MAVRTITIDMDAYERLSRLKRGGMSFSQVIKEHLPAAGVTAGDLLDALAGADVSEETLDAVDRIVARREDSPARTPRL